MPLGVAWSKSKQTASAVRLTHQLGSSLQCKGEPGAGTKNREKAMKVLRARVYDMLNQTQSRI